MQRVKTDRILQTIIAVFLAAFIFLVAQSFQEEEVKVVAVGDTAPDFEIRTDSGRSVSNSNFGGRLLVLNFWATWCPPCVEELPSLNEFQKRLAGSGVVVVGVSVDNDAKAYQAFLDRAKVSFETARDPSKKISAGYGTFKFPETYIINSSGKVVEKIIGATNWTDEKMLNSVKSLL